VIVAAATCFEYIVPPQAESVPARHSFITFPMQIGEMSGHRLSLEGPVLDVLQLDDYLLADFASPGSPGVNLYASYYSSQRDRRVVHSPRACIPGGGWRIERSGRVAIEGTGLMANRMVITNGSERQLVYYWFDQRGRNLTSELAVKWFLFWDALTRHRTDGAMVRVVTAIPRDEPERIAEARLLTAAREVAPLLQAYVPR
jgi:EpsI family protein